MKQDKDKLRMDLLSPRALRDMARVMTHGVKKHGDRTNLDKGLLWSQVYAKVMRHLTAWYAGEDYASDSGLHHLDHAACNIMFLQEYKYTHKELDDRPKIKEEK